MSDPQPAMRAAIDELRRQLAEVTATLAHLESRLTPAAAVASDGLAARASSSRSPAGRGDLESPDHGAAGIALEEEFSEEIVIAIAAAVAAYLGEGVRVRQIRLISSSAWAQQGRVSIQGSHRLDR